MTIEEYDAANEALQADADKFNRDFLAKLDAMRDEREANFKDIAVRCRNIIERK